MSRCLYVPSGSGDGATVSLRAHSNGVYVSAALGGPNAELVANRSVAATWEKFDLSYN